MLKVNLTKFGDNLKRVLKEEGKNQSYIIKHTGLSQSLVSDYANGVYLPGIINASLIAKVLDVSLDRLVDGLVYETGDVE